MQDRRCRGGAALPATWQPAQATSGRAASTGEIMGPRRTHPQAEGAPGRSGTTVAMEERERAPAAFFLQEEHSGDEEARESGRGDSRG